MRNRPQHLLSAMRHSAPLQSATCYRSSFAILNEQWDGQTDWLSSLKDCTVSTWTTDFNRILDHHIQNLKTETHRHSWPMRDLITAARSRSTILAAKRWNRSNLHQLPELLRGLQRIAAKRFYWRRSIWLWFPDGTEPIRQQWNSLSDHLFTDYPLPTFLHNAWLQDDPAECQRSVDVLIATGRGRARKDLQLPVKLTKTLARHFFGAPDHVSVTQAIRWAQLRAEGASLSLTRYLFPLLPLPLHNELDQSVERFWMEAIRFLVREFANQSIEQVYREDLAELLDFAYKLKFSPAAQLLQIRTCHLLPLFPAFSFQGRTLRSVRRLNTNWRTIMAQQISQLSTRHEAVVDKAKAWPATSLNPYFSDEQKRFYPGTWTISELLSPNELRIEGSILGHCVGHGSYAKRCKKQEISIWSLRKWTENSSHRVVTIEVDNNSKSIVTALGKKNSRPQADALQMISNWARQEKLKLFGSATTLVN